MKCQSLATPSSAEYWHIGEHHDAVLQLQATQLDQGKTGRSCGGIRDGGRRALGEVRKRAGDSPTAPPGMAAGRVMHWGGGSSPDPSNRHWTSRSGQSRLPPRGGILDCFAALCHDGGKSRVAPCEILELAPAARWLHAGSSVAGEHFTIWLRPRNWIVWRPSSVFVTLPNLPSLSARRGVVRTRRDSR